MKDALNKNQIKSGKIGGAREGAGRPKGEGKATKIKRMFQDYFTEGEVRELLKKAKEMAKNKPEMMKFVLEQLFGRAPQIMTLKGDEDAPLKLQISGVIANKYDFDTSTSEDSDGQTQVQGSELRETVREDDVECGRNQGEGSEQTEQDSIHSTDLPAGEGHSVGNTEEGISSDNTTSQREQTGDTSENDGGWGNSNPA